VLFGAFYINYVNGWVGAEFFNVLNTELG
jgi:hypothetical protein